MMEDCSSCFGTHPPAPEDAYFDYKGWRFTAPFICMGCGIKICYAQWAFCRNCGACDVTFSPTRRVVWLCFSGPHEQLPTFDRMKGDIEEKCFLDPEDREKHPVLNPPVMPTTFDINSSTSFDVNKLLEGK